jgi:hypothetical protein
LIVAHYNRAGTKVALSTPKLRHRTPKLFLHALEKKNCPHVRIAPLGIKVALSRTGVGLSALKLF